MAMPRSGRFMKNSTCCPCRPKRATCDQCQNSSWPQTYIVELSAQQGLQSCDNVDCSDNFDGTFLVDYNNPGVNCDLHRIEFPWNCDVFGQPTPYTARIDVSIGVLATEHFWFVEINESIEINPMAANWVFRSANIPNPEPNKGDCLPDATINLNLDTSSGPICVPGFNSVQITGYQN